MKVVVVVALACGLLALAGCRSDQVATTTPPVTGTGAEASTGGGGGGEVAGDRQVGAETLDDDKLPEIGTHITLSDEAWKARLSPEEFRILREHGTERPFTGDLLENKHEGVYTCAACGAPLFHSKHKFNSGTGWPSFYQPIEEGRIGRTDDKSYGMVRTEVHCDHCGGHMGHVFDDGPEPTGLRYCINAVSLDFVEQADWDSRYGAEKKVEGETPTP